MPIYQYKCSKCNHKFELTQSFNAEPSASCPACNNGAKRLFIPVPVIFKGSGFYVTDSRKNNNEVVQKSSEAKSIIENHNDKAVNNEVVQKSSEAKSVIENHNDKAVKSERQELE